MMSAGMGGGMGGDRQEMANLRSLLRADPVAGHKLPQGILARVGRFAAAYNKMLTMFVLVIVVNSAIGVTNPLIYRAIIDRGILGRHVDVVVALSLLVGGLAVANAFLALAQRYISAVVGEGLIFDMREKVFGHLGRMPLAFFTRTQTGALVSRLNNDVLGAQRAFTNTLSSMVSNIVTVALTIVAMGILSWQITLASLVLLPLFVLPARRIARRLGTLTKESYNLNADMNTTMSERFNVSGALLVKLYGDPAREHAQFADRAGQVRDIGVRTAMYGRIFFISLALTSSLATALVYGWGGVAAVHHQLDVGTVVALSALLSRLYGPLTALSSLNVDVMTALVSFQRVFEILDLAPMISERPGAKEVPPGGVRVDFFHVDFTYPQAGEVSLASLESVAVLDHSPSTQVLHNITFSVEPGQMVALVGPSGAGKTTIGALAARLYDVSHGSVCLSGIDVRELKLSSIAHTVGMVTQDAHLFHDTIEGNLRFAKPEATDDEIVDALKGAYVWDLVEKLPEGVRTVVGDRGHRLSGGEKQRIALARLLLKSPAVVILDEATAHLDSESEAAVKDALATALLGRTSIVIAHRLSTIREADKILVIDGGCIVESGVHDRLLEAGGLYAELYRTQFGPQARAGEAGANQGP